MANPGHPNPNNYISNPKVFFSTERQFAWLDRSRSWPELDSTHWRAKKVLGEGGNSIVGLWNYIGPQPPANPRTPANMVIKQCNFESKSDLMRESKFLHLLTSTGTEHIVKLYRGFHAVGGTGTLLNESDVNTAFDELPFDEEGGDGEEYDEDREIGRIYMEYLPGGDLEEWKDRIRGGDDKKRRYVIPEEVIWRIMGCMVRAILVLESGTEDPMAPDTTWNRKIIHFDMKIDNFVIADNDNTSHQRFPIVKLMDFGMSRWEPYETSDERINDVDWVEDTSIRYTQGYASPEQLYPEHENRDICAKNNVWGIGATIYRLICRETIPHGDLPTFQYKTGNKVLTVVGKPELLLSSIQCPYSKCLINTLCRILTWDPSLRIPAATLIGRIDRVIDLYDAQNTFPPRPPPPFGPRNAIPLFPPPPPGGDALAGPNKLPGLQQKQKTPIPIPIPPIIMPYKDPDRNVNWEGYDENADVLQVSPDVEGFRLLFGSAARTRKVRRSNYPYQRLVSGGRGGGKVFVPGGSNIIREVVDRNAFPGLPIPSPRISYKQV